MLASQILQVIGEEVVPENIILEFPQGWSIIAYLRTMPASMEIMFLPFVNNLLIAKNSIGEVYWPLYGLITIGSMNPGEGYQIKITQNTSFSYPPN